MFLLDQAGRTIMALQAECEQLKAQNDTLAKAFQTRAVSDWSDAQPPPV